MRGDRYKYGYEAWFGFSMEMLQAVAAEMRGAHYEVTRRGRYLYGDSTYWTESRDIHWSIRWEPERWDGCWVLYVSAQAAMAEAERRCHRAMKARLTPGTRVRLTHLFHFPGQDLPAGTPGWVSGVGHPVNGVNVLLDGLSGEHDIGQYWVVPIKDAPTEPQPRPGGIYRDERSI